jgi:hypothetical protein
MINHATSGRVDNAGLWCVILSGYKKRKEKKLLKLLVLNRSICQAQTSWAMRKAILPMSENS